MKFPTTVVLRFSLPEPLSHKININLQKRTFRCGSLGYFSLAAKRINCFESDEKIQETH